MSTMDYDPFSPEAQNMRETRTEKYRETVGGKLNLIAS